MPTDPRDDVPDTHASPTRRVLRGGDSGAAAWEALSAEQARAEDAVALLEAAKLYRPDDVVVGLLAVASPDTPTCRDADAQARSLAAALRAALGAGPADRTVDAELVGWLATRHPQLGGRTPLEVLTAGQRDAVLAVARPVLALRIAHWFSA